MFSKQHLNDSEKRESVERKKHNSLGLGTKCF